MSDPPNWSPLQSDEVKPRPRPDGFDTDGGSPSFPRLKRMVTLLGESSPARVEAYLILLVIAAAVITAHRIL